MLTGLCCLPHASLLVVHRVLRTAVSCIVPPFFPFPKGQMESRFGLTEVTPVGVPRQEQVVAVGRVCCESTEGKINRASILLEVSDVSLPLDFAARA